MRGRLIAFEGGEASGKSTQAARLASRLDAVLTREPGGTPLGETFRSLLLDPASSAMAPRTEALLMAAARAQHVAEVVGPALASGRDVVTDRFVGSSLAYQGVARGLGVEAVQALSTFACDGVAADVVVLLDVPPAVAAARVSGTGPDRLEAAGDEFHAAVASGFTELAAAASDVWVVVDGTGAVEEVAARVWAAVRERLGD
jgi:dTMP kinase